MKTKYKVLIIVFAAIIVLTAIGTALFLKSPEYMLIKLYSDVKENGFPASYQYMTVEFANQIKYLEDLSKSGLGVFVKMFFKESKALSIFDDTKITLEKTKRKNNRATAFITVDLNEETSFSAEIYIVKTYKGWKISGFGNIS